MLRMFGSRNFCDQEDIVINLAIIVAAGKGTRMGMDTPKQLLPYEGGTVLGESIKKFYRHPEISGVIIVSPEDGSLDDTYRKIISELNQKPTEIVRGGAERGDSVKSGLGAALKMATYMGSDASETRVLIHDAARPGVDSGVIDRNLAAMEEHRAAVAAIMSTDSIRKTDYSLKDTNIYPIIDSTVIERNYIYMVQTPQTFYLNDIIRAYEICESDGYRGTDDASVAEHAGIKVVITEGASSNNKITIAKDLPMKTRVGTGYDVHRLVLQRPLILCGTPVPSELGLLGHSDADVATHALMDALLGAAAKGDIGQHFPDSDDRYKGADSLKLLAEVKNIIGDVSINNVDITIIAQKPKLAPYVPQMKTNIARTLGIPESSVNVKATTTEKLGFEGRGEGIAALATCAIEGRF